MSPEATRAYGSFGSSTSPIASSRLVGIPSTVTSAAGESAVISTRRAEFCDKASTNPECGNVRAQQRFDVEPVRYLHRSEERRVGKECGSPWWRWHYKKKEEGEAGEGESRTGQCERTES